MKAKHSTTENPCSILNSPLIGQDCTFPHILSDGQSYEIIERCPEYPNDDSSLVCFGQPDSGSCQVNPNLDTDNC